MMDAPEIRQDSQSKPSTAERRKRTQRTHRLRRLAIQIVFFILAPAAFSGAFNGVKYVFAQIGAIEGVELTSFLVLLLALLGFTIVFGRIFCGYACAFGTLGDVLHGVAELIAGRAHMQLPQFPRALVKVLSLVKYIVLAAICVACVLGVWGQVSHASPWVAFAGLLGGSLEGIGPAAWVLLALVAVGMILRERFFCQFLCPLGAVFSLMPVLGFSEYTRNRAHCARRCGRCCQTCPVDIWPDADTLGHGECIACGQCADVCPMDNVNLVAVERSAAKGKRPDASAGEDIERRPLRKTKDTWYLLRGTGTASVVVKVLLLLAVLWAAGATRYIPAFAEIFGALPFSM